jgi:tryptophanyl-tRNA synthetase
MARDIGQRFNHLYGEAYRAVTKSKDDPFVLPEAVTDEHVATLPGLDGRKMSKSYNNTIPLWLPAGEMKRAILGIVTDSRAPGEAKDTEGSNLFAIYQAFASPEETAAMRQAFAEGIAWGEAKQRLFKRLETELGEARERYDALIARPDEIEDRLLAGATKARERSAPLLAALRETVGLGSARALFKARAAKSAADPAQEAPPQWKRYRESDGKFYFRLVDGQGDTLLQSVGFDDPQLVGAAIVGLESLVSAGAQLSGDRFAPSHFQQVGEITRIQRALVALNRLDDEKKAKKSAKIH